VALFFRQGLPSACLLCCDELLYDAHLPLIDPAETSMTDRPPFDALLFADIQRIKEEERQRIARDLHDELGSQLTAIKMALAQLRQQLPTHHPDALAAQTDYADRLTDGAIDAMHNIIDDLYPAVLDLGLPAALAWLIKLFARQTGVPHRLLDDQEWPTFDAFCTVSLYRIAREALHNAARHAGAKEVTIALYPEHAQWRMEITDDGIGLQHDLIHRAQSSGIRGMHARAAAMGATLHLLPTEKSGLTLQVRMPIDALSNTTLIK